MNRDAQSFVYCLFTLGKNEDEAHSHLKKNLPEGQEVDIAEIADFYSRIRIGEYQFNSEKHVSERVAQDDQLQYLMDLPEECKRHVVLFLDASGRSTLRRVSPFFRDFVDKCPIRTNKLSITIGRRSFTVTDHINNIHLDYERIRDGALLHRGVDDNAVVRRGDYKAMIKTDLIEILGNPRLKIGILEIKEQEASLLETRRHGMYSDMVDAIHQALVINLRRGNRLKVEKLVINIAEISNFTHILTFLDAAHLREILLGEEEVGDIFRHIARFWQSPQWQNTKKFRCRLRLRDPNFVRDFSHLDWAEVRLAEESFSSERLMQLVNTYLRRPTFNQMRIDLWEFNKQRFDIYLMNKEGATRERNGWSFRYPESQKKLFLTFTNDLIWFKGPEYREPTEEEEAEQRPVQRRPLRGGLNDELEHLMQMDAAAGAGGPIMPLMEALRRRMGL